MKYTTLILLVFISVFTQGQNYISLKSIDANDTIPTGQSIIYGNFIQRLGFSSGGFQQDIRLINIETKEVYTFIVKSTFKSTKENTFCYCIKPGTYAILNYWWTQSKWYGGQIHTEPIYKDIDATDDFEEKIKTGQIKENDLKQYTFTIEGNTLNYLGTWHFDSGLVSFTNDKEAFDKKIDNDYLKLDFSNAKTIIPN